MTKRYSGSVLNVQIVPANSSITVQAGQTASLTYKVMGIVNGAGSPVDVTSHFVFWVPDNYLVGDFPDKRGAGLHDVSPGPLRRTRRNKGGPLHPSKPKRSTPATSRSPSRRRLNVQNSSPSSRAQARPMAAWGA